MDLDELRSVRRTERQKDSLQHLRDSFYEDVAAFIAERKAERKRLAQQADDPFSDPDVGRLTDEIETAEDVVEAIYERRVGKVVKLASFAAADMNADTGGLTAEERDLFEDLVARIKQNRNAVLDVLAGEGDAASESPPPTEADSIVDAEPTDAESAPDDVLAEAMGGGDAAADEPPSGDQNRSSNSDLTVPPDAPPDSVAEDTPVLGEESDDTADPSGAPEPVRDRGVSGAGNPDSQSGEAPATGDGEAGAPGAESSSAAEPDAPDTEGTERVTLRITEDVGQIFGVDEREYDLATEDVVTLPTTNAGPLLERDAAERLE